MSWLTNKGLRPIAKIPVTRGPAPAGSAEKSECCRYQQPRAWREEAAVGDSTKAGGSGSQRAGPADERSGGYAERPAVDPDLHGFGGTHFELRRRPLTPRGRALDLPDDFQRSELSASAAELAATIDTAASPSPTVSTIRLSVARTTLMKVTSATAATTPAMARANPRRDK